MKQRHTRSGAVARGWVARGWAYLLRAPACPGLEVYNKDPAVTQARKGDDLGVDMRQSAVQSGEPVHLKTIRLVNSKRLKRLAESYAAISPILDVLHEDERCFAELKYWKRKPTDHGISQRLHIFRRTVYNWREKVLRMNAEELVLL